MSSDDPNITDGILHAAVVVAHPDDEVLWCGGLMLMHPDWRWSVATLCRGRDPDRAPRFDRVMSRLGATGTMGDLDDGPDQTPMDDQHVRSVAQQLLERRRYDLVLTHGPRGEYTRHRRHEECCRAVVGLWCAGEIQTSKLWLFAYEDQDRQVLPRTRSDCDYRLDLTPTTWQQKHDLIVSSYGFAADSWEARATPRREGFWCFDSPDSANERINQYKVSS